MVEVEIVGDPGEIANQQELGQIAGYVGMRMAGMLADETRSGTPKERDLGHPRNDLLKRTGTAPCDIDEGVLKGRVK